MNSKKLPLLLIGLFVILTASFFRFSNLNNWGLFIYDEGQYINEARYFKSIFLWSKDSLFKIPFSSTKAKDAEEGVYKFPTSPVKIRTGRPLHTLVLSLGFFNTSDNVNSGNYLIAFLGTLTIIATLILAYLLTNSYLISLVAAFLLAINPLHIYYSRTTLAEADSALYFILSLISLAFFFKKPSLKKLFISGILLGFAYITNGNRISFYSLFFVIFVTFIFPLGQSFNKFKSLNYSKIKLFGLFTAAFIIPLLISEFPYYLAFLLTHNLGVAVTNPTYFEQVLWLYSRHFNFGENLSFYSLLSYPYILIYLIGIVTSIFFLIGFIHLIKARIKLMNYIILLPVGLTLLISSMHILQPPRAVSPIIPLISIISAIGIYKLSQAINTKIKTINKVALIFLLCIAVFIETINTNLGLIKYESHFPEVISYLNKFDIKSVVTTNDSFITVYNPAIQTRNYQLLAFTDQAEKILVDSRYLLTTIQKYTISTKAQGLSKQLDSKLESIEANCLPIFSVTDISNPYLTKIFILEHNFNFKNTYNFLKTFKIDQDSKINLYDYIKCPKK